MQAPVNLLAPDPETIPTALVVLALLIAFPLYFIIRFLRAYERRSIPNRDAPSDGASIAVLADEVAALRTEVANLSSAQDFTTRLLLQGRPADTVKMTPKDATTPNDGESKS